MASQGSAGRWRKGLRARTSIVIGALILQAVVAAELTAPTAQAATAQYPDLQTLAPRDLRFGTATIAGTSHRVLQFSNSVVNVGEGRLDIVGEIDPVTRNGSAFQHVFDDAGNYDAYLAGQLMWHDIHSHFHYENWGRYELWDKADYDKWVATGRSQGQAKKVGTKTTSCILDEEFIQQLPGTPYPGKYPGSGCDVGTDWTLHEGLSPGWGDTYDWYRDEQWIDLDQTPLADGSYVLRSVTDPLNVLYESPGKADPARESQTANEAMTAFVVSGGVIQDGTAPTGTLLIDTAADSTTDAAVTVGAIGRDDVSGVDRFRLSNDGVTWKEFTYTSGGSVPTVAGWNLTDPAFGGTTAVGTKTVYGQFHDRAGKWGPTMTDTITYGTPPPPPPPPPSGTGYAGTVTADGPVGYWRLGETSGTSASDAVGTHTGSYTGNPSLGQPSLVPTETDRSVGLTGSNAVRIPDAPDLQIGAPLTLEAWIRPANVPGSGGWASIVSKPESYSLQFNGQQLELTIIQNGERKRLKAPTGTIVAGQTYHVVGTYDGTMQRLYINGRLVASGGQTGPASLTPNSLTIGSWDGTGEFFTGTVDDVAVYAKALTGTQVSTHYSAAQGAPAPTTKTVTVATTGAGTGTVTSSPAGISCPPTCSAEMPTGATVTLTAAPASGSTFSGWTAGACTGTSPTCTFSAIAATSATASFAAAQTTQTVSVATAGAGAGTVTSSPAGINCPPTCSMQVPSGSGVTLTAAPASGSTFSGWSAGACTGTNPTCTFAPTAATSVTASFATSTPPPGGAGYSATVSADAPLSYWRLGETSGTTAADVAARNPGTYVNGTLLNQGSLLTSDANPSASFDGVNDHVRVANASALQIGSPLSLEAWIRPTTLPAAGTFRSVLTKAESYSLQFNGPRLELTIMQAGARKRLQAPVGTFVAGQTYHVVGTYDGATQRLYVNGALVASAALTGPATSNTNPLVIGSWGGTNEFFAGRIDEVAVYTKALTSAQVQAHYSAR